MCHRQLLETAILKLLNSRSPKPWHNECELEDFFFAQGYDPDLVRDLIDELIDRGALDFDIDRQSGDYLLAYQAIRADHPSNVVSRP